LKKLKVKEGYVYHIHDRYMDLVQGFGVKNKTVCRHSYPAYCVCKDEQEGGMLWMVPMSTNVVKYRDVIQKKIDNFDECLSIVIGMYDGREVAFQLQDMFPVLKKHILKLHTRGDRVVKVESDIQLEVRYKFDKMMEMHNDGKKCIFTDIESIKRLIIPSNDYFSEVSGFDVLSKCLLFDSVEDRTL